MSYAIPGLDPISAAPTTSGQLRAEPTWTDVRDGLGRIVTGYLLIFLGNGLGIFLVLFAIMHGNLINDFARANGWYKICLIVGAVLLGTINVIAYFFFILVGHWRCTLSVPDRCGARWMMFICMTCIVMGPVMHSVAGRLSSKEIDIDRVKHALARGERPDLPGGMVNLQLICGAIEALNTLFFLLFLRSVAYCFDDRSRVRRVEFYIVFLIALTAASTGVAFLLPKLAVQLSTRLGFILIGLCVGWLLALAGYFYLIFTIRTCIAENLGAVRSPLDLEPEIRPMASFVPGNML